MVYTRTESRRVACHYHLIPDRLLSWLNFSESFESADKRVAAGEQERDEVRQELESERAKNSDGRKAELTAKVAAKDDLLAKVKVMREKATEIQEVTREVTLVSYGRSFHTRVRTCHILSKQG